MVTLRTETELADSELRMRYSSERVQIVVWITPSVVHDFV